MLGPVPLFAQEMLGIMNSSRAGITGSVINPAVPVTSPFYVDINIVAANVFVENNYVYLAKEEYRFKRFFEKNPVFPTHGPKDNQVLYDVYNQKDKNAYANVRLLGPSFSVTVGRHSFGIVTGARAVMSTRNVPFDIAKFAFEQLEYPPQFDVNYVDNRNVYNAELAWMENGFNYSYVIKQKAMDYWAGGITVKNLQGYGGGYLYSKTLDYVLLEHDTLIIHNATLQGGYALPLNYETNQYMRDPFFKGKGIGMDIGVIYEKKKQSGHTEQVSKLCAPNYIPYVFKIGVSIIDIGRVKFTHNAEKLVLDNKSTYWPGLSLSDYSSVREFTNSFSNQFYGDTTSLIQGNEIIVGLPTALSVQADVNYRGNWFFNGTLVYPLQVSKSGLIRPAVLGLTPRYETTMFEASLPLTLYDWSKPRIGLSARFRGFYIGTEKISGFFHFTDFTGLDLYVGLKLSLRKGNCHSKPASNCGYNEYKKFTK